MFAQKQIPMQGARIKMSSLLRGLPWLYQLSQWFLRPAVRRRRESSPWPNGGWDVQHEQIRLQPTEAVLEQVAVQGGTSLRLLLYSLLP
jgi:hypothetical protein